MSARALSKASRSEMLTALQRGIPLAHRPFEELARDIGCCESDIIDCAREALDSGRARRFGAVFDARRLGFRTTLCCADLIDPDSAAAFLSSRREVSHCYLREAQGCPNLWWTWSAPADVFDSSIAEIPFCFRSLPATRRYKVDVVFGGSTRARDERTDDDLPPPDDMGRRIIRAMQGDTELREDYFACIADKIGMKEWNLLSTLEMWRRNGRLKRIGLLLNHRKSGFTANGMCCFRIDGSTVESGRALAEMEEVSHCYERPACPEFPYNLFAMIHCSSVEEANAGFDALKRRLAEVAPGPTASVMLISTKEYKKTSLSFFD